MSANLAMAFYKDIVQMGVMVSPDDEYRIRHAWCSLEAVCEVYEIEAAKWAQRRS